MSKYIHGLAMAAAIISGCDSSFAAPGEELKSANGVMSGCRQYSESTEKSVEMGWCIGSIEMLRAVGPYLQFSICVPPLATARQVVRVVVQYVDSQPARLNEDFRFLAAEALRATWPCKR
jgi:Rap1a immunity proteins